MLHGSHATHKYIERPTYLQLKNITTLTVNFHSKLPLATGPLFYKIANTPIPHVQPYELTCIHSLLGN